MRRYLLSFLLVFFLLGSYPVARVRPLVPTRPVHTPPGLQFLANRAGLIFAGTVLSVERIPATQPNQIETVDVRFRVEQPVRGVNSGQTVGIREWGGLWVGRPRYQVGQRLLVFLYPPSKLGLTSPVTGIGNFAVDRHGWLRPSPTQQQMLEESGLLSRVPIRGRRIAVTDFARTLRRVRLE